MQIRIKTTHPTRGAKNLRAMLTIMMVRILEVVTELEEV